MRERHKTIFSTILCVIVLWFIIILFCMPQNEYRNRFPQQEFEKHNNNLKQTDLPLLNPPRSPDYMKYFQTIPKLSSVVQALFYEFDPSPIDLANLTTSVDKTKHEKVTLELRTLTKPTDKYVLSLGDKLFAFNLLVSNRIGLYRPIPDTRHKNCPRNFDESLRRLMESSDNDVTPRTTISTSIIICYYNEAPSALLRTIYSLLKRSPLQLIKEILIIDDSSLPEYHIDQVRPFLTSELIKMVRTEKREGLIRARLFGANLAKGDIMIFLDSHVEANEGWLEPLIDVIRANRSTIACPMIDLINADSLIYSPSPMVKGGLNWNLNFKWDSVPSHLLRTYDDFIKPIYSPTMAGGLYAIDKEFFFHLGSYDPMMDLWGGENIELSIRTWLCGGKIVILPCSRMGHIFRKKRPYGPAPNQPDSLLMNSLRSARVWLDEHIDKFYELNPGARELDSGNITQRLDLRKSLNCNNFTWFLDNVYPEMKETKPANATYYDEIHTSLFDVNSRRFNRSARQQLLNGVAKGRKVRRIPHHARSIDGSAQSKSRTRRHHTPRILARFQIQSANTNLCIESKSSLVAKDFHRLILNDCAILSPSDMSKVRFPNESRIFNQLWTETDTHEYRLGDDQCLDLIKNFSLLRKCHGIGSFQSWNNYNNTTGTYISNIGGGLCLGVERTQVGEPIIVTICDRGIDLQRKARRERIPHNNLHSTRWLTGPLVGSKTSKILKPTLPNQRWNLILVGNSTSFPLV